jgi:hypothetical protein
MLRRALSDVSETLDSCVRCVTDLETEHLLSRVRDVLDLQISRVESSLREIDTRGTTRRFMPSSISRRGYPDSSSRQLRVQDLVARYQAWADQTPHWWAQATTEASTRSDEILGSLSDEFVNEHAGEFIDALPDLELFVLGTADLSMVEAIWTRATDPATTSSHVAGQRIRRLLDVIFDDRPWESGVATGSIDPVQRSWRDVELRNFAARIVAPWQLEMTSRSDWGWTPADGARRLHQMSKLESAADILFVGLAEALRHSLALIPEEPADRRAHIDAVARAVGTSLEVHQMSDVDRARSDSDFDTLRTVLGTLAIDGPWPISILIDAGAQWVGDYFDTSDARIDTAILESLNKREILASIAVVTVMATSLAQSRRHSSRTSDSQPTIPSHLIDELRYTYQSIDNSAGRGQSLARLTRNR